METMLSVLRWATSRAGKALCRRSNNYGCPQLGSALARRTGQAGRPDPPLLPKGSRRLNRGLPLPPSLRPFKFTCFIELAFHVLGHARHETRVNIDGFVPCEYGMFYTKASPKARPQLKTHHLLRFVDATEMTADEFLDTELRNAHLTEHRLNTNSLVLSSLSLILFMQPQKSCYVKVGWFRTLILFNFRSLSPLF